MISDLEPYPAYRDSDLEWLGEVPEGWEVLPARSLFREVIDRNHPDEEMLSVTIKDGVIPQASLLEETSSKDGSNQDKSGYKLVQPGDIAYNKMRAWQGAAGCSPLRGIVSPAYIVMRSRGAVTPAFAHRLLRIPAFAKEAERWSYGITSDQWSLRAGDFKQIYLPVPPAACQGAIIRFLDDVDARIQRLISAKERLIDLLEEEKEAVASHIFTHGLDPDAPRRPSGVDWLGDLPGHWEVMRFKFVARTGTRLVDPRLPEFADQTLIAPNHVQSGTGRLLSKESARQQGAESGKYLVRKGEVVYSKIRPALRKAIIAPVNGLCSADMYPIAPRESMVEPRYLLMAMLSQPFTRYVVDCSLRVAMPKVNREALGNAWVPVPSLPEQREMVELLAEKWVGPDRTIARTRRQIALLTEFRTRLASDVVMGKLDVRKAAASLAAGSGAGEDRSTNGWKG